MVNPRVSLGPQELRNPRVAATMGSGNNVPLWVDVSYKLADAGAITMVKDNEIRAEVMRAGDIFNQTD